MIGEWDNRNRDRRLFSEGKMIAFHSQIPCRCDTESPPSIIRRLKYRLNKEKRRRKRQRANQTEEWCTEEATCMPLTYGLQAKRLAVFYRDGPGICSCQLILPGPGFGANHSYFATSQKQLHRRRWFSVNFLCHSRIDLGL
jgi:hypothetical protein